MIYLSSNKKIEQNKIDTVKQNTEEHACNSTLFAISTLKPLILAGNYTALNNLTIYKDEEIEIKFSDDKWLFRESLVKGKAIQNLTFEPLENDKALLLTSPIDKVNFINQIKCYALVVIKLSPEVITLSTLYSRLYYIRKVMTLALASRLGGFEQITLEHFREWIKNGESFSSDMAFSGFNSLLSHSLYLPFNITTGIVTFKSLNITPTKPTGKNAIPFRIWSEVLSTLTKQVHYLYEHRDEIEQVPQHIVENGFEAQRVTIEKLRNGEVGFHPETVKSAPKTYVKFIQELKDAGIPLIDYGKNEQWLHIFKKHQPTLNYTNLRKKEYKFLGKTYTIGELNRYLSDCWNSCSSLCLFLSGMRVDELYALHPEFGSQKLDLPIGRSVTRSEKIYIFTTRQSKITRNTQKLDDVFVTTIDGYKAFQVLRALSKAYLPYLKSRHDTMFANTKSVLPKARNKSSLHYAITRYLNMKGLFNLTLTQKDIDALSVSEGAHPHQAGDILNITPHMTRRSLAYYLVGYELCSLPALKQQLSHFSMAMTRWYARNATKYTDFWRIIEDERISQKADICVRIFEKLANGERLSGGKGAAYLREIQQNPNYFNEGVNQQLLSKSYWEEMLKTGAQHLHAIAPSMYCTNSDCSMRIAIDLTECVDCEFDYIEDVAYAEGTRINAMYKIERLLAEGELNPSSASKCYMDILASEQIMRDLDFNFEPYCPTKEIRDMVINYKVVS
ncbi:site-specific integrase [Vibrio aestuarianus]|uniref:site-specific integrase n=1 Tax=Vibrio aestuarianus TaxID=28171 RepID=UPI00237C98FB|nr:site-specific integrase [Vibrio aestuarianus]MDE1318234.1 site-specific integrase [Vibrio aestuarianus]